MMPTYITPGTSHHERARLFGEALRQARIRAGLGTRKVADAAQVTRTQVMHYEQGRNIPSVIVAARIAAALDSRVLLQMAQEARQRECVRCKAVILANAGRPATVCSEACRQLMTKAVRKPVERDVRLLSAEVRTYRRRIAEMCGQCPDGEDGFCRLAECPLRSVSPLPFALDKTPVKVAVPIVRRPRGVRSTDR